MSNADTPAMTKMYQPIEILYAKSCNHLFIKYHDIGAAIINAITTSFKKSLDKSFIIVVNDAPNTFLIPISLVRFSADNAANPNKPKQARKIEMPPAHPTIFPQRCSLS